jgi:hypothetical protein
VKSPIPAVEIADHTDALGVGRPDGEAGSLHAIDGAQLRAQLIIEAPFIPFAEEV